MSQDPVLVTGAAGFIGFCLARRLLENGRAVVGVDSVNSYYDPALKEARLAVLRQFKDFTFHRIDLADRKLTEDLFQSRQLSARLCTSPRKRECVIRCKIHMPISTPISSAFSTFWRVPSPQD